MGRASQPTRLSQDDYTKITQESIFPTKLEPVGFTIRVSQVYDRNLLQAFRNDDCFRALFIYLPYLTSSCCPLCTSSCSPSNRWTWSTPGLHWLDQMLLTNVVPVVHQWRCSWILTNENSNLQNSKCRHLQYLAGSASSWPQKIPRILLLNAKCKCQQMTPQIQGICLYGFKRNAHRKVRQVANEFFSHHFSFLSKQINAPMHFLRPRVRTKATCKKVAYFYSLIFGWVKNLPYKHTTTTLYIV